MCRKYIRIPQPADSREENPCYDCCFGRKDGECNAPKEIIDSDEECGFSFSGENYVYAEYDERRRLKDEMEAVRMKFPEVSDVTFDTVDGIISRLSDDALSKMRISYIGDKRLCITGESPDGSIIASVSDTDDISCLANGNIRDLISSTVFEKAVEFLRQKLYEYNQDKQ